MQCIKTETNAIWFRTLKGTYIHFTKTTTAKQNLNNNSHTKSFYFQT